jgi:hypothetical protein
MTRPRGVRSSHTRGQVVLDLWERLDVALFGIGGPAWSASAVGDRVERQLEMTSDAVGEVLVAPFDIDGRFVCRPCATGSSPSMPAGSACRRHRRGGGRGGSGPSSVHSGPASFGRS